MSFLKNKHVITALIVAPILSIVSYFAVDHFVSETPHKAVEGKAYPLVEKPSCRYSSGHCDLKNGEFEITFTLESENGYDIMLVLSSKYPLQGAKVAVAGANTDQSHPRDMKPRDAEGLLWQLPIAQPSPQKHRLQIAVSADNTLYYGEASTAFTEYETSFEKDFRAEH